MSNLVESTGRRLAREMVVVDSSDALSYAESRALEAQASALLADAGYGHMQPRLESRPFGAEAIDYGDFSISPSEADHRSFGRGNLWSDDGMDMLGHPVSMGMPDVSVLLDVDGGDAFDPDLIAMADDADAVAGEERIEYCGDDEAVVVDAEHSRDIVASSHMSYADALELVSVYGSAEGRAMIAARSAAGAVRRHASWNGARSEVSRLSQLERAEERGRIAPHMVAELAALRAAANRVEASLVDVLPSDFEHSYSRADEHIPFEYASHRGYAIA